MMRRYVNIVVVVLLAALPEPSLAGTLSRWQVPGTPAVTSQEIVFRNAGAVLHGVLYRPAVDRPVPQSSCSTAPRAGRPPITSTTICGRACRRWASPSSSTIVEAAGSQPDRPTASTIRRSPMTESPGRARSQTSVNGFRAYRLLGAQSGGWLAVLAASRDPRADFVVSVSAPLVTPEAQMEFAMSNRLTVLGYPKSDVNAMLSARKAWTGYLAGTLPRSAAVAALRAIQSKPWFDLMYLPSATSLTTDPSTSSWRKEMNEDMMAVVAAVRVPALFIYGGARPVDPRRRHPRRSAAARSNAEKHTVFRRCAGESRNDVRTQRTMELSPAADRGRRPTLCCSARGCGVCSTRSRPRRRRLRGSYLAFEMVTPYAPSGCFIKSFDGPPAG